MKRLVPGYGLIIVAEEAFNLRDTDMTAQFAKVWSRKPQVIVTWTIGPAGAIVAKNVKQLGISVPLFQCHGLPDSKYIELAGPASEGNLMPSTKLVAWERLSDSDLQKPVMAHFVRLYREKLREAIENTKNYVGVSGLYNLTPEDHNGLDESSMIIVKIVKGRWVF